MLGENKESYLFQSGHGLQYVLSDMLNKYFIAQIAENTFIFALVKNVKTGIFDYLLRVKLKIKISRLFFQAQTYLFRRRNEIC